MVCTIVSGIINKICAMCHSEKYIVYINRLRLDVNGNESSSHFKGKLILEYQKPYDEESGWLSK